MTCTLDETSAVVLHESASDGDATVNPATLCAPLGAVVAAAGIEGAVPLLHGAQGCATYIRRYVISHFREPMDVASSSFGETETVFGGEDNLGRALDNVTQQYRPMLVAVATTCLAETIGEDVPLLLRRHAERRTGDGSRPRVAFASTPSYRDGHIEGFHAMVHAIVRELATETGAPQRMVNLLVPMISPEDLRHLREIVVSFGIEPTILPDYSDRLDGGILDRYVALPEGGTKLAAIAAMPRALGTLDFTMTGRAPRASEVLVKRGGQTPTMLGLPIGVRATDALVECLATTSGTKTPGWLDKERSRLLDAYADGHKYVFGKRVGVYGDPELVTALAAFLLEIGARPVVCATGARNRALTSGLHALAPGKVERVLDDSDFMEIERACRQESVELLVGSSKGYRMSRALEVPLVRVGFPIHDRLGANRVLHLGYRGTLRLFDTMVNALLESVQSRSSIGFSYL